MKKENSKKNIGLVIVGILLLVGAFYGGMVYGKNQASASASAARTQFGGGNRAGRGAAFGGFTTGEIISNDDKSITVKLMDGGSKIIFLDNNTKILKQTNGTLSDLANGTQVSIMGAANSDGSINATSVQIRPQTMVK